MHLLWLVPVITLVFSLFMYRFNGRRWLFRFDAVQFLYTFVVAPLFFVWFKSVMFVMLQSESVGKLTTSQLFVIDTLFSLVLLYIFAFVVMHSLTKSFSLNKSANPNYNLFTDSEYVHLWLSHIVIFGGGLVVLATMAVINVFVPLALTLSSGWWYLSLLIAIATGCLLFAALWLADPHQKVSRTSYSFMQLMKLILGVIFSVLVSLYFFITPAFTASHIVYWWVLVVVSAQVVIALFMYKSVTAHSFFENIFNRLKHQGWNFRVQLFKK